MGNEEFLKLCKEKVSEYTNQHMDKTEDMAKCCVLFLFAGRAKK